MPPTAPGEARVRAGTLVIGLQGMWPQGSSHRREPRSLGMSEQPKLLCAKVRA